MEYRCIWVMWWILPAKIVEYWCRGVGWCRYRVNIVEYLWMGSGDAVIRKILMIQISIHIVADSDWKSWNIDAEGLGDTAIGRILMMWISMNIDTVVWWISAGMLMQINADDRWTYMQISMQKAIDSPKIFPVKLKINSSPNHNDHEHKLSTILI